MKTKLFLTVVFLSLTILSCKKNNKSPKNILTSKVWHWGITDKNPSTNPSGGKVLYHAVKDCEKDNTFKFGVDGKLTINTGTNKCDSNESQTESPNYSFNSTTKTLVINGTKYTLTEESKDQIKYYAQRPSGTGYEYEVFLLE